MEVPTSQATGAQEPRGPPTPHVPPSGENAQGAQGITSLLSQLPIQAQRQLAGMTKERLQQIVTVRCRTALVH